MKNKGYAIFWGGGVGGTNKVHYGRCARRHIGNLSKEDDHGSENVGKTNEFAFFQTQSRLFGPAKYFKCRRIFLEFIQVQKDKGKFVVVCPRPP